MNQLIPGMLVLLMTVSLGAADRAAPKLPLLKQPVWFNTPEADALLSHIQLFPADSAWHEDISRQPVHPDSAAMIARIGADKHLAWNLDMAFVIVPTDQPRVAVKLTNYADESDPGPYPVPDNAPIEGWPLADGTLEHIQRVGDGDRHLIVLDPYHGQLWEFYQGRRTTSGWQAAGASLFDLTSNRMRPMGWTSSDAAGLPILPAVVRYDECARGVIDHALRFTVKVSRKAFIYPATHHAGSTTERTAPAMGQRFRLKDEVKIDQFPPHARAIATALKRYGMFVADNGGDWRISVAPDSRITGLEALRGLTGADFEVVQTTGEHDGPRAPDAKHR